MKRNHLNGPQRRKLQDAILDSFDSYILAKRPTMAQAAEHFQKLLGFPITENNVSGAMNDLEREWPTAHAAAGSRQAGIVKAICRYLSEVARKTNTPLPPELQSYLNE